MDVLSASTSFAGELLQRTASTVRVQQMVQLSLTPAFFLAATSSLQRPSREALMPRTVKHAELPAANALSSLGMQLGVLVGPAVGGLLRPEVLRGARKRVALAAPRTSGGRDRRHQEDAAINAHERP